MKRNQTKKLAVAAVLTAVAVVGSTLSFPVFGSRCAPVQHMVNILCAVLLGPWYGVVVAFLASLLRVMLGLGTLLAFPGSMCGALLCGLVYWKLRNLPLTLGAEVFGTGILGGLLSWPVAVFWPASCIICWRVCSPLERKISSQLAGGRTTRPLDMRALPWPLASM